MNRVYVKTTISYSFIRSLPYLSVSWFHEFSFCFLGGLIYRRTVWFKTSTNWWSFPFGWKFLGYCSHKAFISIKQEHCKLFQLSHTRATLTKKLLSNSWTTYKLFTVRYKWKWYKGIVDKIISLDFTWTHKIASNLKLINMQLLC